MDSGVCNIYCGVGVSSSISSVSGVTVVGVALRPSYNQQVVNLVSQLKKLLSTSCQHCPPHSAAFGVPRIDDNIQIPIFNGVAQ